MNTPPAAVQAIGCIQLLFAAGLSSTDLAGVLPACGDYSAPMSAEKAAGLKAVRERLTAEIEERQSSLHLLDEVMAAARGPVQAARLPREGY